jgi:ATP-dependent Lon protease
VDEHTIWNKDRTQHITVKKHDGEWQARWHVGNKWNENKTHFSLGGDPEHKKDAMDTAKQKQLIEALENRPTVTDTGAQMMFRILTMKLPAEIQAMAMAKYQALQGMDPSTSEYFKQRNWLDKFCSVPFGDYKELPVTLASGQEACGAFMGRAKKCMDESVFGQDEAKLQIMQFVSQWIANPQAAGNVLSIHGPPGVGKTTLIKDGVAKALGRPFHFITLGGATDASFLDGHSYTYEGSTWGRIVDVLIKSKCMNPVIYFDELDKVSETPKGEEINNLLIHLTDGSQNDRFQDKYFTGIDLDLSRCLFIFSHNNHERVNPILRDRMYNIQVSGFDLKQKLIIAEQYLVAQALNEVNLFEKIGFSKELITHIIENFTGDEGGVRELKRCIQTVISKLNLLRFYNDPAKVPFAIKGFSLPFTLKKDHVDLFLKKKPSVDASIAHLYV